MKPIYESRERADIAADKLKIYAQPQRLMILSYLLRGERTVSDIDAATGIGQPALSQKLAELRRNDLVTTRRASTQIWYSLADDKVALCVRCMEAILDDGYGVEALLSNAIPDQPNAMPAIRAGSAGFVRII
jgi:DNA-binding transcriptional ArsR family regulator